MEIFELVEAVDILEYIAQYTDFEEKNGEYWALSPLKEENTPSFSVDTSKQRFYDFSSGIGGDVLSFIEAYHRCGTRAAIKILKEYAGISDEISNLQPNMTAIKIAKRYLPKKGKASRTNKPLPPDIMDRYECKTHMLSVWEDEGVTPEILREFDVRYDAFAHRIVYPIRNEAGQIINIQGRTLIPDFKERGVRKYTPYKSWENGVDVIYGLWENREYIHDAGEIILFEGAKSVMVAASWGYRNCGAVLTSHINPQQQKVLIKLGCKVVIAFDKDTTPWNDEAIKKLRRFLNVRFVKDTQGVLGEKDSPVDKGEEVWKELYLSV